MSTVNNPLGSIFISHRAIASIASRTTMESYGVVGLAAKNLAEGLSQVLVRDPLLGVDVDFKENAIAIDLYVIVEYGVRIKSVASSISENVKYRIEKDTGLSVDHVDVHIRGLRISNSD
ncbi:MAG: Asp23/Gls24 family envelope stress response protein [Anaerolineaceae bacterium]